MNVSPYFFFILANRQCIRLPPAIGQSIVCNVIYSLPQIRGKSFDCVLLYGTRDTFNELYFCTSLFAQTTVITK